MAQSGYTPIQLYYSSTTTNVPLAANLAYGELAINITDGKLFYKDNANAVQVIGWKVTPTSAGGTGLTSYTAGDMVYYASGTTFTKLAIGTADYVMTSSGTAPQWSQFLKAIAGGTGQTSYAVGDLLYANTTTTLAKLPDVATGNALISGGVGVAPSWGKIGLTTHISGVLPVANGGTNASTASITSFNNITGYTASGATGTTSTNLVFSTSPSITTPTLVGNATLSTGNLVQGTAAKGFNFTANTAQAGMTSQLLNWYEEGVSTVTLAFGGASTGITYNAQECRYTRIGNRVFVQIAMALSNKGSATGATTISGLPFTSKSVGYGGTMMTVYADNMAGTGGAIFPFLPENSSTIQLKKVDAAGNANVTVANTEFNNTSYLMISGQYLVA
jgi:hypothetical protein